MKDDASLKMFARVSETLEKNLVKWDGIIALREIYDEFMKNFVKLKKLSEKQIKRPATLLNEKNKLLNQLAEKVIPVANILEVYRTDHVKKNIRPVKITRNKLLNSKDPVVLKKCGYVLKKSRKLFNKANKNAQRINSKDGKTNILSYGLVGNMIHELEESYEKFKTESDYVGSIINQEKKITGKMKSLVSKNKKLLSKKLDKLMVLFESKDPEFHQLYNQSREAPTPETQKRPKTVGRPVKIQPQQARQRKTQSRRRKPTPKRKPAKP
ncbi:MAG: hypothetical protein JW723_02300 [Bacteroidales bacterium]|nr:hypothetical protein [Bacteroidales bacterium]